MGRGSVTVRAWYCIVYVRPMTARLAGKGNGTVTDERATGERAQSEAARLRARVQLLLWRTQGGVPPATVAAAFARARRGGYAAVVEDVLTYPDAPAIPPPLPPYPRGLPVHFGANEATGYDHARTQLNGLQADANVAGLTMLRHWWVQQFVHSDAPLRETLALFWHNHFATGATKVGRAHFMLAQNQLFRTHGAGQFGALMQAVAKDAAMLVWLDGKDNAASSPNENWARECLELFTCGLGHFTERDVREAARASTGWTLDDTTDAPRFDPRRFDSGTKTLLGQTGNLNLDDLVWIAATHPRTRDAVCRKLFAWFVSDDPTDAELTPLTEAWDASGGEVRAVLRALFLSDAFTPARAGQAYIKHPVAWAVGAARALEAAVPPERLYAIVAALGMDLFDPPDVGGWHGGLGWVSPHGQVLRFNLAGEIADGIAWSLAGTDAAFRRLAERLAGLSVADDARGRKLATARPDDPQFLADLLDRLGGLSLDSELQDRLLALGREGPDGWRAVLQILLASPAYQTR